MLALTIAAPASAVEVGPIEVASVTIPPPAASSSSAGTSAQNPTPKVPPATRPKLPPEDEYDDAPSDPLDHAGPTGPGLTLSQRVTITDGPAAPTTTPEEKKASSKDVDRGLDGVRRSDDSALGFGNREERTVGFAVRTVLRSAAVRDGARARVIVDLAPDGTVLAATISRTTQGDDVMWAEIAAGVRAALGPTVELSPTAQRAGIRIVVDAKIVHVLSNGTDGYPVVGECPKMPDILNDLHPAPFGLIGGAAWDDRPNGTCALQDIQDPKHKHIEVRTVVTGILPDIGPPPFATLDAAKPKRQRPTLVWMIFGDHATK